MKTFLPTAIVVFSSLAATVAGVGGQMEISEGGASVTFPAGFVRPVKEAAPPPESGTLWISADPGRGWMAMLTVQDLPQGMNPKLAARISQSTFLQGWGQNGPVQTIREEEMTTSGHCALRTIASRTRPDTAFIRTEHVTAGGVVYTLVLQTSAESELRDPLVERFFSSLVIDAPAGNCSWSGSQVAAAGPPVKAATDDPAWVALEQIERIATGAEAFATDENRYPAAVDIGALKRALEPVYIRALPVLDPWGTPYHYTSTLQSYRVASAGADRKFESGSRTLDAPPAARSTAPGTDLVFQDGSWVQHPSSLDAARDRRAAARQAEFQRIVPTDVPEITTGLSAPETTTGYSAPQTTTGLSAYELPPLSSAPMKLIETKLIELPIGNDWSSPAIKSNVGKLSPRTPSWSRPEETEWCIRRLALAIEDYFASEKRYPAAGDLQKLFAILGDERLRSVSRRQGCDSGPDDIWGSPLVYRVSADGMHYRVLSYGSDRKPDAGSDPFDSVVWGPTPDDSRDVIHGDGMFFRWHVLRAEPGMDALRAAANEGKPDAEYELARRYDMAYGVREDDATAIAWYRKAAERGDVDSQVALGERYRYGNGVEADTERALYWLGKAAAQGSLFAQEEIDEIRSEQ